jgi:hypothetical protein
MKKIKNIFGKILLLKNKISVSINKFLSKIKSQSTNLIRKYRSKYYYFIRIRKELKIKIIERNLKLEKILKEEKKENNRNLRKKLLKKLQNNFITNKQILIKNIKKQFELQNNIFEKNNTLTEQQKTLQKETEKLIEKLKKDSFVFTKKEHLPYETRQYLQQLTCSKRSFNKKYRNYFKKLESDIRSLF